MKKSSSLLICLLVIISMTALNVVWQNYICEKTFNIVASLIIGLITIFLFSFHTNAIYRQFHEAKIVAQRRYTLLEIIKVDDGAGKVEIAGALLSFWDDTEHKQVYFFKDIEFAAEADLSRNNRFVAIVKDKKVILNPLS